MPGTAEASQARASTREFFGVPNPDGYVPILLETLRLDSVPDFDLYNKVGSDYIMYRRGKHPFNDEQRRSLLEHRVRALYVPQADSRSYWTYVQSNIASILADPQLPPKRKAEVFHTTAIGLTRQVLLGPASGEILRTASEVVKGSAQLLVEGRQGFHAFLSMVGKVADLFSHAVNVCTYGVALAQGLRLPADALAELGIGLLLHDLGMVGVPEDILKKPSSPSPAEWEVIRSHPERGLRIYQESGGQSEIAKAVIHCHHERIDGGGYPRRLSGDAIPLVGRIAAIVNVFDALTTSRPFRPALTTYEAIVCMKQDLRQAIDQDLLDHFVQVLGP